MFNPDSSESKVVTGATKTETSLSALKTMVDYDHLSGVLKEVLKNYNYKEESEQVGMLLLLKAALLATAELIATDKIKSPEGFTDNLEKLFPSNLNYEETEKRFHEVTQQYLRRAGERWDVKNFEWEKILLETPKAAFLINNAMTLFKTFRPYKPQISADAEYYAIIPGGLDARVKNKRIVESLLELIKERKQKNQTLPKRIIFSVGVRPLENGKGLISMECPDLKEGSHKRDEETMCRHEWKKAQEEYSELKGLEAEFICATKKSGPNNSRSTSIDAVEEMRVQVEKRKDLPSVGVLCCEQPFGSLRMRNIYANEMEKIGHTIDLYAAGVTFPKKYSDLFMEDKQSKDKRLNMAITPVFTILDEAAGNFDQQYKVNLEAKKKLAQIEAQNNTSTQALNKA